MSALVNSDRGYKGVLQKPGLFRPRNETRWGGIQKKVDQSQTHLLLRVSAADQQCVWAPKWLFPSVCPKNLPGISLGTPPPQPNSKKIPSNMVQPSQTDPWHSQYSGEYAEMWSMFLPPGTLWLALVDGDLCVTVLSIILVNCWFPFPGSLVLRWI